MSNIAVFNPGNLPAFAKKGELSAVAKSLMGSAGGSGKRVSIKGGVFRLISEGKEVAAMEERYLDVVIVNAAPKVSRTFYAGTYDENKAAAPDCWSQDGSVPDASIKAPQHSNCANCPKNAKGSGQGDSRACRFSQRLAVVLADDIEGDVMQLSLAATSIFGRAEGDNRPLQEHARWLAAQGIDPTMLVTRLKFDTTAPVPKLFFKPMRWLTDEEFAATKLKGDSPEALAAITMTVSQTDNVPAAAAPAPFAGVPPKEPAPTPAPEADEPPASPPRVRAVKAKTAPLPPEPEEDAAPEPTVRIEPAPKVNVPAAAAGLAATLAEWDDE
jgi:hypothetical protein